MSTRKGGQRPDTTRSTDDSSFAEEVLGSVPLATGPLHRLPSSANESIASRMFNRAVAAGALMLFLPVMSLVALLVKVTSSGPVLQRVTRLGKDGKSFLQHRFRTRSTRVDVSRKRSAGIDEAYTPVVGRWLQLTALEELPGLLNVVRGEMNFVGPRPESPEVFHQCLREFPEYYARLLVRPGMTGPAQMFGARTPWDRLLLDIQYILKRSVLGDLKLLLQALVYPRADHPRL
ncbi:MAG TPA: sugar transferase [Gemmatimonadaceae bacterium]|nr:sugar transferase [Gemmatimonadaceae bacterium]